MNLFNILSLSVGLKVMVVTCDYHLLLYGNELVRLLIIIMFTNTCAIIICLCVFMYACQLYRMIGYDRTGSVFPFCLSVDCLFSTHFRSNWFVFDIP